MDLHVEATLDEFISILESSGFRVERKAGYTSAVRKAPGGRLHATFIELEDEIYCDFHFDHVLHFLMLGVDYRKRPRDFFEKTLQKALEDRNIAYRIHETTWFGRRNKAVFRGFRV